MKILEDNLKVFSLGQQQDFKTIAKVLINLGITLEQYIYYVEEQIDTVIKSRAPKLVIKNCPDCKSRMLLFPVNISKTTITGDDSKSVWMCTNKKCMNTIYNKENN